MRSILQIADGRCYLCEMLKCDFSPKTVEEHHAIGGTSRRRLSEKYGLKVYLCPDHHRIGKHAVHKNAEVAAVLKDIAQRKFELEFPELDFMAIFSKNYKLDEKERMLCIKKLRGEESYEVDRRRNSESI